MKRNRAGGCRRAQFVRLLQHAYSGELGAALGYAGHATSVADPAERDHIRQIRREELDHRAWLGGMLRDLGAPPDRGLELRNACLGCAIAAFCHAGGWFLPMYGAGWIEARNIAEYERAACLARECSLLSYVDTLLEMAEAEWEHARFFRLKAASHPMAAVLRLWPEPAPKAAIRDQARRVRPREALATRRARRGGAGASSPPAAASAVVGSLVAPLAEVVSSSGGGAGWISAD